METVQATKEYPVIIELGNVEMCYMRRIIKRMMPNPAAFILPKFIGAGEKFEFPWGILTGIDARPMFMLENRAPYVRLQIKVEFVNKILPVLDAITKVPNDENSDELIEYHATHDALKTAADVIASKHPNLMAQLNRAACTVSDKFAEGSFIYYGVSGTLVTHSPDPDTGELIESREMVEGLLYVNALGEANLAYLNQGDHYGCDEVTTAVIIGKTFFPDVITNGMGSSADAWNRYTGGATHPYVKIG